jgi:hypothetical protein
LSSEAVRRYSLLAHLLSGGVVFLGLILPYHINGRAWYDYGWSGWNPPEYHFSDGKVGHADYDPKFTRPTTWPVLGKVFESFAALALLGIVTGAVTSAILVPFLFKQSARRVSFIVLYLAGTLPIIYNWSPLGWKMWTWWLD